MKVSELDNEYCDNCGTDLFWWVTVKNKNVYEDESETLFCSKKCFREDYKETLKTLKKVVF